MKRTTIDLSTKQAQDTALTTDEHTALHAEWDAEAISIQAKEYADKRRAAYPAIGDQLDMLWHAMEVGEIPKATMWFEAVQAIKEANPNQQKENV